MLHSPRTGVLLLLVLCCTLLSALPVRGEEASVITLWPLLDYRRSETAGYTSVNLLGPLVKLERTPRETRFGLRPLFFHESGSAGSTDGEALYPVATWSGTDDNSQFQVLHWLEWQSHAHGDAAARERGVTLFPFLFYQTALNGRGSLALFPVAGRMEGMYGRDDINFFLFPLYSRTRRHDTEVHNLLWPLFARVQGPDAESGWKFWPLVGWSEKPGVYSKRFFLWPFWSRNELDLDGTNPLRQVSVFPFWSQERSPQQSSTSILWPFFNHIDDSRKDYEEWDFPWPLLRLTRGESHYGLRLLPLYSDETRGVSRKRWWLWPLFNSENREAEVWSYQRQRVCYFLYADTREHDRRESGPRLHRVDFWPLFHYEMRDGVGNFSTVALLEPFFPGNERIARSWAPLWRLYQLRWDRHGNEVSSFLWNLYWKERRAEGIAWELFPLLRYRRHGTELFDVSFGKGLVRYRRDPAGQRRLMLLFLPWGIPLGDAAKPEE